jgi:hypothetical protein
LPYRRAHLTVWLEWIPAFFALGGPFVAALINDRTVVGRPVYNEETYDDKKDN